MTFDLGGASYLMNAFALQTMVVAVAIFSLGAFTLAHERWSTEGILFWLCTLTIGVWLSAFTLMYSSTEKNSALYWARAAYFGVPFIPSAIYHFSVVVLRISSAHRRQIVTSWLMSAFFAAAIFSSDTLISGLYHYSWGYYPKYGWLSVPYLAFFFGMMIFTLRHYWVETRHAAKGTNVYFRAKILLIAFVIAYLGSVDYLAKFGIAVYPVGYLFVFCFLIMSARVIWRYRLVDLTPAYAASQILETMDDPLIVCDLQDKICIVNPAFSRLLGYQKKEAEGRRARSLFIHESWHQKMISEGHLKDYEGLIRTRNDETVCVALSASTLRGPNGQAQGYVIVVRDVTERKRIEQELKTFNETLEGRVQKRTEELANKIRELEWLNTVMLGREERVLELKEELRRLKQRPQAESEEMARDAFNPNADH